MAGPLLLDRYYSYLSFHLGPADNPAQVLLTDTPQSAIRKIARTPGAFWLARVDDSTISNKESLVVATAVTDVRRELGMPELSKREVLDGLIADGYSTLPEKQRCTDQFEILDAKSWDRARQQDLLDTIHPRYKEYTQLVRKGFYRPIKLLPAEATARFAANFSLLSRAIALEYYTMSDYGIWNNIVSQNRSRMAILLDGYSAEERFFLNPAFAVQSTIKISRHRRLVTRFMEFLKEPYLQNEVVPKYKGKYGGNVSLFAAPHPPYKITQSYQLLDIPFDSIINWE